MLTIKEVSERLGVDVSFARSLSRKGKIPGKVRLGYRTIRFDAQAIEEWLENIKKGRR